MHPEIDNPEYEADANLYKFDDIGAVGFDLWQVKAGTIFDNILVTDDARARRRSSPRIRVGKEQVFVPPPPKKKIF